MRLVVVSPFLDRRHGTELCVIEQIERLARLEKWTIDLYSQRVEQLSSVTLPSNTLEEQPGSIVWHKVPGIPGPHLLKYLWWIAVNRWQRGWDQRLGQRTPDLVYSPGINCMDADVIVVHVLFHALYERVRSELALRRAPLASWPRLIHRKLYYRLLMLLENRMYRNPRVSLIAVSTLIARKLEIYVGRGGVTVIPNAVDTRRFSPEARLEKRAQSRKQLSFAQDDFVVLLIGNDWKNKGLEGLLGAAALLHDLPIRLLIVGEDAPESYTSLIERLDLQHKVEFSEPSEDVLRFYAAADLYAGPSMEDSFCLPIAEAMACGLPVIASVNAGASELIRHQDNGVLLHEPTDATELASLIRTIVTDGELRERLGRAAARTIQASCSWDQNAERTREFLQNVLGSDKSHS